MDRAILNNKMRVEFHSVSAKTNSKRFVESNFIYINVSLPDSITSYWDFGDLRLGSNSTTVVHQWSIPGQYAVRWAYAEKVPYQHWGQSGHRGV